MCLCFMGEGYTQLLLQTENYRGGRELANFDEFITKMTSGAAEEKKASKEGSVPEKDGEEQVTLAYLRHVSHYQLVTS